MPDWHKHDFVLTLNYDVSVFKAMLVSPTMKIIQPRYVMLTCSIMPAIGLLLASFAEDWFTVSCLLILLLGTVPYNQ